MARREIVDGEIQDFDYVIGPTPDTDRMVKFNDRSPEIPETKRIIENIDDTLSDPQPRKS